LGGILITHLLRWLMKRLNWLSSSFVSILPKLMLALIGASLCHSLIVSGVQKYFELPGKVNFTLRLVTTAMDMGLLITTWVLIYYFYHFIEKPPKKELDTLRLESMVRDLEIRAIKSQLNPDFIFNALNSIRQLVDENPTRARNAITELSNTLRSGMKRRRWKR
jgi:two-component system LytT family sensor kinase